MAPVCVGGDLSATTIALHAIDKGSGETIFQKEIRTSQYLLCEAIRSIPGELYVNLEAGELASWAIAALKTCPNVKEVVCSHAKSNKHIACDPLKNDRVDARKLAEMLRLGNVHRVELPQDDRLEFKRLVLHYERVTREEIRLKNILKSQFRCYGVFDTAEAVYSPDHFPRFLERIPAGAAREMAHQQFDLLQSTLKAQRDAEKLMAKMAKKFPEVRRLRTIPGVGLILATRFVAYIHTPARFSTRSKFHRYCRLGIMNQQTGGVSISGQRLDFNGCPALKDLSRQAFNAAVLQSGKDNAFKRSYQASLQSTHNRDHARLNTQRKMLNVMLAVWKNNEDYNDDKLTDPKG